MYQHVKFYIYILPKFQIKILARYIRASSVCEKDLCHFLQQFIQVTASKFNSRKNKRHSAIPVAINLYLLNCDCFFCRIKLDLNFVSNVLFLLSNI